MLAIRTWLRVIVAACLGLALLHGGRAWAASFEVSPIRLSLSPSAPTALLTVRNQSAEILRFHVTAFAWAQSTGGEMELQPTQDLIVFPTLFSLKPGESRHMRVGATSPFAGVERTYRIFVEELPPADGPEPGKVRVRTRMGVPVFQSPAGAAPTPAIDALAVQHNQLAFSVRNKGNAFFLARHVRVDGLASDGKTVFSRELPAWYVLAGGLRSYTLDLPPEACAATRLRVSLETETAKVESSLELPPRACAR